MKNRLLSVVVLILVVVAPQLSAVHAQQPMFGNAQGEFMSQQNNHLHTSIKPYNYFEVTDVVDSLDARYKWDKHYNKRWKQWLFNGLFNDDFITIGGKEKPYTIKINPLFNIRVGNSSDQDGIVFNNTRGVQIMGNIGSKFIYYTDFFENQSRFPLYVQRYIENHQVVPGQGFPKIFSSQFTEGRSFDYSYVNSYISYQPNEYFNFQAGQGKHFIGEGHRSLLLSDYAFNYPYFKITTSFWKIKYVNLYAQLKDLSGTYYGNTKFTSKYMVSHYLSLNVTKRLNIGLYETVIHQNDENPNELDLGYLNPIVLYRPIEFALGSRQGNALMGLTSSYKIKNNMMLYAQFMLDEFKFDELFGGKGWWANKYAIQLGFKSYDTFTKGLTFLTELNYARPFTYSHRTTGRNYGHYYEPIAHPLGANFKESVTKISYQKDRWFGELELMIATQGLDSLDTNYGSDVFKPYTSRSQDYNNETLQGIKANTLYTDLKIGYIVNPITNLRLELGATYRSFKPELETETLKEQTTTYIYFGLRTAINNLYYDF